MEKETIIEAQSHLISFYEGYISGLTGYLYSHSMLPNKETVDKGNELRNKIIEAWQNTKIINQEDKNIREKLK